MAPDVRDQLQATLGDAFTIERELLGGGMSRVFVALERSLGRRVAIKLLPPDLSTAVSAERFRREIQVVAQLQHPHIVPVYTTGEGGGMLFYTMPFVDGESLRQRLQRDGRLPVTEATTLLADLADALGYAHAHGVVHRDIKPENVLLSGAHAMLADFGVARALSEATGAGRLTTAGITLGTPAYMAPEQVAADPTLDHRADIYSLGLVAYEMLAGETPFGARTPYAALAAHVTEAPRPLAAMRPEVPGALASLVMRCLEKSPGSRPQAAEEIALALRAIGRISTERTGVAWFSSPRRRWAAVAGVATLVALAAVVAVRTQQGGAPAAGAAIESVVVLPLVNAGSDAADEYFADGMTDELTSALAKVPGLRVASHTSAFAFKGRRDVDVRTIGQQLRVAAVLEGRVRRDGNIIRVSAQLSRTDDGLALWSDTFQRERTDVFAMQDDLTRAIVGALRRTLGGAPATDRGTANLAAYDLYLKGRFFWNQRSFAALTHAVEAFGSAVRLDAAYALAHAGLADSWSLLGTFGYVKPADAFPKGRAAAERAVQLDSTLAEPHVSLGMIATFFDWDWNRAAREFARARALNPSYGSLFLFDGWRLAVTGHLEEALASVRHARELEPLSMTINTRVATMLRYLGRYDEAERDLRGTLALDSSFFLARSELASVLTLLGRYDEALRVSPSVTSDFSRVEAMSLGYLYGRSGRRADAMRVLDSLRAYQARRFVPGDVLAMVYVGLGDWDQAFEELERGVRERSWSVLSVGLDPAFAPLWKDARLAAIRRATNLGEVGPSPALRAAR